MRLSAVRCVYVHVLSNSATCIGVLTPFPSSDSSPILRCPESPASVLRACWHLGMRGGEGRGGRAVAVAVGKAEQRPLARHVCV